MLREAITYWDERGGRRSLTCNALLLGGVGVTIAVHHLIPLAVALLAAGIVYIKD